jgi:hypothetical protein
MKFFYALMILIQLTMAFLSRNENKTAYLLYLWNNLSGSKAQVGRRHIKSARVSKYRAKYRKTKSNASDIEYSLFLKR